MSLMNSFHFRIFATKRPKPSTSVSVTESACFYHQLPALPHDQLG